MTDAVRTRLDEQLRQVEADLRDLPEQVAAGDLDETVSATLRRRYTVEQDRIRAEITALDDDTRPVAPKAGRRRAIVGTTLMVVAGAVVAVLAVMSVSDRPPGGFATGGIASDVVAGNGIDLSTVTNEQLEEVVAANPGVIPMRAALAERYFEENDFSKALEHYLTVLDSGPHPEAFARIGWMSFLSDEPELALSYVERALELTPEFPEAQWYVANIRVSLGDGAGAIGPLESLLGFDNLPDEFRTAVEVLLEEARSQT